MKKFSTTDCHVYDDERIYIFVQEGNFIIANTRPKKTPPMYSSTNFIICNYGKHQSFNADH